MREIRCGKCNKLLAKVSGPGVDYKPLIGMLEYSKGVDFELGATLDNLLEIKCPRCRGINRFSFQV